ncbi:hypothetical protein F5148DRAFT_957528, partial [Russula earlei]
AVCTAIEITKCTLNKYYLLTDTSEVYQIAMVLHPHHKLAYFEAASQDQVWIDTAKQLVQVEFELQYS